MNIQDKLIIELKKASIEHNNKELVFESEWLFDLPTQSLSINGKMLHSDYDIPTGLDGYGLKDLQELENKGFLTKISVVENEHDPEEITIKYLINY